MGETVGPWLLAAERWARNMADPDARKSRTDTARARDDAIDALTVAKHATNEALEALQGAFPRGGVGRCVPSVGS